MTSCKASAIILGIGVEGVTLKLSNDYYLVTCNTNLLHNPSKLVFQLAFSRLKRKTLPKIIRPLATVCVASDL